MPRLSRAAAALLHGHPVAVVSVTMLAALVLSIGLTRLEFRTGQETLIDPTSKVAMDNERFQAQFGGDPMLVLFDAVWDPFPKAGPQREPYPHLHNSAWVQSPGRDILVDTASWPGRSEPHRAGRTKGFT